MKSFNAWKGVLFIGLAMIALASFEAKSQVIVSGGFVVGGGYTTVTPYPYGYPYYPYTGGIYSLPVYPGGYYPSSYYYPYRYTYPGGYWGGYRPYRYPYYHGGYYPRRW